MKRNRLNDVIRWEKRKGMVYMMSLGGKMKKYNSLNDVIKWEKEKEWFI